jgi:sigma 54 modulation/S30EA-like ribosomal protein
MEHGELGICYGRRMPLTLQINFRGIERSEAVESDIRQRAARLERFGDAITGCTVTVEMPHQHRHRGDRYGLRIELSTIAGDFSTNRAPTIDDSKNDFHSVIRDAFQVATQRLEQEEVLRQHDTLATEGPSRGVVARLFTSYGFLVKPNGEEVYFGQNSLTEGQFEQLAVGSIVGFELGPEDRDSDEVARASSVSLLPA